MDPLAKILAVIVISVLAILLVWAVYPDQSSVVQPIAYNHKVHIEEGGLECTDCHRYVEKMAAATIPGIEICQDCHGDEPISDSPEEIKLLKYIEKDSEIPWKRIYELPDHVYFSHRRHIVLGELDCSDCHGNVAELTAPARYPYLPVTMDNCINCHELHKVSTDCLACHR